MSELRIRTKSQLASGAVLSYVNTVVNTVVGIVYTPIVLRMFGQSEYGLYSLASTIMSYLFLFDFGFSNAVIKYVSHYKSRGETEEEYNINAVFLILYSIVGVVALAAGIILYSSAGVLFRSGLTATEIAKFKVMILIVTFNLGISFPSRVFSGSIMAHERFAFLKVLNIVSSVLTPLLTIGALMIGYRAIGVLVLNTIINLLMSLLQVYFCCFFLKMKIRLYGFDPTLLKEIVSYSFYIFLGSVVDVIYQKTDVLILGAVANVAQVAVYSIATTLDAMYTQYTLVISSLLLPKLVKMVSSNATNLQLTELYIKISRIQFLFASLILSGYILIGQQFIIRWAGTTYSKAYIIELLIMCVRLIPITQVLAGSILQAKNLHAFRSKIYLLAAVINVLASIFLGRMYGGIGCAIGSVIGIVIQTIIMNWYYVKVGLDMNRYYREVFILIIPVLVSFLVGLGLKEILVVSTIRGMAVFAISFVVCFMAVAWALGLKAKEKNIIKSPFRTILQSLTTRL